MGFRIDIYHHFDSEIKVNKKLDEILKLLDVIRRKEDVMSAELDALTVQVTANTDVEASAILLLQGLAAQIAALKTDPVALQALSNSLKMSADNLAAAITANTPPIP